MKRSQQINIALTKLPPVNSLKQAILSMDNSVLDKEALEVRFLLFYLVHETFTVKLSSDIYTAPFLSVNSTLRFEFSILSCYYYCKNY